MIRIELYKGDYTDLPGLELEGHALRDIAADLAVWDVYVGYEDDVAKGFFVLSRAPETFVTLNPLRTLSYVPYLANTGSPALVRAMAAKVREVMRARGIRHFSALNAMAGVSDETWMALFKNGGAAQRLGSFFLFDAETDP
jgi:hypothetical protein